MDRPGLAVWMRLLRPHHWLKNLLVAVPLATAHQFTPGAVLRTLLAFAAFSICASCVYVLNDMIDVEADRAHPLKKARPFASGALSAAAGVPFALVLLAVAMTVAALISPAMLAVLAAYFAITLAYSLVLKRKMMIDVVTLAVLYAIRIIGGGVAIAVPISEWLLAFSLFIFTSLALIKRHSELGLRLQAGLGDPTNRNYRLDDLPVIAALAAASGYCAVIIFALYLSSDTVRSLYRHPEMLWLACPLLVYWISRVLLLSHRRLLIDDPVVFAMKDKVSIAVGALMVVVGYLAM
jgi:4-hydroxybenzoate polyprenyltransferase